MIKIWKFSTDMSEECVGRIRVTCMSVWHPGFICIFIFICVLYFCFICFVLFYLPAGFMH